jgi:hypothetical protein
VQVAPITIRDVSPLKFLEDIKGLIEVLLGSDRFHVLVVQGPPGWGKTYQTRTALNELGVPFQLLGSYSTPLALFNKLVNDPRGVLVVDDTAGLFYSPLALSILNSASWTSADGRRTVIWSSTTERAAAESVDFRGKLIVLTNFMPESPQARAFINRSLHYPIAIDRDTMAENLQDAARSAKHFPDADRARDVAEFLIEQAAYHDYTKFSLRTLEQGYELAKVRPDGWRELLMKLLPKNDPEQVVRELYATEIATKEQVIEFCRITGRSRRTFFNIRDRLGLRDCDAADLNVVPIKKKREGATRVARKVSSATGIPEQKELAVDVGSLSPEDVSYEPFDQ